MRSVGLPFTFKGLAAYCAVCALSGNDSVGLGERGRPCPQPSASGRRHRPGRWRFTVMAIFWLAAVLAAWVPCSAFGEPKTKLHLLLSATSARPGDTIWAGLEMDMPPAWHTYWRNGGDAGEPPKINWDLPPGFSAGEINWPIPAKLTDVVGDTSLVTYIYTNKVVLLVPIKLDKSLHTAPVELKASVKWMECSDLCVFGTGSVTNTLA